ncbi:MAG: hypothetical protein ACOCRX_04120 [Candidatus Woesearchaeota archaeon]
MTKLSDWEKYERHLEKQREYEREMRALSREIGNCTECFQPKDDDRYRRCLRCRILTRERDRRYRRRKKEKLKEMEEEE